MYDNATVLRLYDVMGNRKSDQVLWVSEFQESPPEITVPNR